MKREPARPRPGDVTEWAIRWEVESAAAFDSVCDLLDLRGEAKTFEVRYRRVVQPTAPESYQWIIRTRADLETGALLTTFKLRGLEPYADWVPPIEAPLEANDEWDVSIGPDGPQPAVFSHSVTISGPPSPPDGWVTEPWGAPATMKRLRIKLLDSTVEEWLIRGKRYIEVSRRGTPAGGADFAAWAAPALAGATPVARGKTQLVTSVPLG